MANFQRIFQSTFRATPFRFIGEVLLLGLIVLFVEFRITEKKTIDWRQLYSEHKRKQAIDPDIVVVKIDDYAFRSIAGGEVSREYIASLVNELKSYSPRVIGLDFHFTTHFSDKYDQILSEVRKSDPDYSDPDKKLMQALKSEVPVVLGADLILDDKEKIRLIQPIDSFLLENVTSGFTKVNLDKDDVCREVFLFKQISGSDIPAFSTRICQSAESDITTEFEPKVIRFFDISRTFSSFSSKDILNGKFRQISENWFRDKIILVGVTYSGSNDSFKTPLTGILRNREDLPGVYIHAMIVKNILNQQFVPDKKRIYSFFALFLAFIILAEGIILNKKTIPALVFILAGILHILLSFRLFLYKEVNVPILVPLLILFVGLLLLFFISRIRIEYTNEQMKSKIT